MTRRASSVKTANKTATLVMFALLAALSTATAFCVDANAKGDPLWRQQRNHLQREKERELEAEAKAYAQVPGELDNPQQAKVMRTKPEWHVAKAKKPSNATKQAQATQQAQANQAGNNAGDIAREQAIQAIDYCQRVMKNFTTQGGNRWNRLRDGFFIPMAILLILPGAVLTQVRAIIAQSNPVMAGQASPLEGIQRAIIGVFLVPSTYLVVNYSIDLGNSLQYTIASEYKRLQGTDMYQDAMCAEIRAFGVRYLAENEGSIANLPKQDKSPRGNEPFAKAEGMIWGKLVDPCLGINEVPANRDDYCLDQGSIGMRMAMNMSNAGINTAWSILTAFQMAFMYYLYCVGPIMAALWTWPMKLFKDAFPAWVEGVVTLAFWSFFWNVVILIIALSKSEASTGLYIVSACNFLATAAVKYAFDFAGLMRGAASEAEKLGAKAAQKAAKGGGSGGKGGKGGKKSGSQNTGTPAAAPAPAPAPAEAPAPATALAARSLIPKPVVVADASLGPDGKKLPSLVPQFLTVNSKPLDLFDGAVEHPLPPLHDAAGRMLTDNDLDPFVITTNYEGARFNPISKTWENPIPMAGGPVASARNTIGSVIGNAIQAIFAYPTFAKIVDPDSAVRTVEKRQKPSDDFVETIECETDIEAVQAAVKFETPQKAAIQQPANLNQTPTEIIEAEESEMKNVAPPSTVKVEEERFSFTPPPLVEADRGKSFDATMSVSDIPLEAQTCNSLLDKMADVVSENNDFAPSVVANANLFVPQAPQRQLYCAPVQSAQQMQQVQPIQNQAQPLTFAQELAQVYAAHMPRVFAEQEAQRQTSPNYTGPIQSFISSQPVQEEVITVVDFTKMAAPVVHAQAAAQMQVQAQPQQPKQTNSGLAGILSNRGLAKAPVNQEVSNSWFA